jgi:CBS domain-containing protein
MKVKELMTTDVVSVNQTESLSEAARLMWERDCGAIPVLDIVSERILGMITDRDICMALWSKDRPASTIRVSEVTSRGLYACNQDDSVTSAEKLMRMKQVRRIPVLDQHDELVGILFH